jgi:hypothetical protein
MIDLKCKGAAIGVVSVDQMSPVIADSLSAQLVRAASLRRRIGGNHAGHDPVRRSGERSYQSAQERAAYNAHRLRVPPASEMTRITTFSPMGPPSAASSKPMQRPSVHRGFGRWRSGITKTASRRTAMPRRARQRWRRSRKAGGANDWPRTSRPPKAIRLWVRSGRKTTMRRWFAIFQRFVHRHPPFSWGQTALRPSPFAGARYLR